jgi:hypothetical protein
VHPSLNSSAASAASTIWAMKTLSRPCGIGDLGGGDDVLAEEMAEAGRRVQIDVTSDELAELALETDELEEADPGIGGKLDEYVDVALGAEVLAQDGAEEGEAADAAPPTEGSQPFEVNVDLQTHAAPPLSGELHLPANASYAGLRDEALV